MMNHCTLYCLFLLSLLSVPSVSTNNDSRRVRDNQAEQISKRKASVVSQQEQSEEIIRNNNALSRSSTSDKRFTETSRYGLIGQSGIIPNDANNGNGQVTFNVVNKKHKGQTLSKLHKEQEIKSRAKIKKKSILSAIIGNDDNKNNSNDLQNSYDGISNLLGGSTHLTQRRQRIQEERRSQSFYSLSTPMDGANGNYGVMFDVTSPKTGTHSVTIKSLEINANVVDPECPVKVYVRKGPHKNFETTESAWKLLVDDTINCLGFGQQTIIPNSKFKLDNNWVTLVGGDTLSFYIYMTTPDLRYGNGNSFGAIMTSNSYLQLREGSGLAGFFQTVFAPRAFNGVVNFIVDLDGAADGSNGNTAVGGSGDNLFRVCDQVLATTYVDNLGSYGNMYDVETKQNDIEIFQVDIYTDVEAPITYEIYTKAGSYADGSKIESWTLLERGTTNGLGNGMGTPIRNFAPFTIPANSIQGFYVTLTTPDLRYRNITTDIPDAKMGDTYFENEDLEIEIGIAVGSYPLGTSFFGPRVWSGGLHYTVQRQCPTFAPSVSPYEPKDTWMPTITPSAQPTKFMQEPIFGDCTATTPVMTTLQGGTGAFGNMFTIRTHDEAISINTLEVHAENEGDDLRVFVFTKLGDYVGYEDDPSAWRKICDTRVTSAGSGFGTLLPEGDFDTIHMLPNQQRALYITMETPDIRYSRSEDSSVSAGDPIIATPYMTINAGAGLTEHPFSSSLFEPRLFNGRLIVKHTVDCFVSTDVVFSFVIQTQPEVTNDEVIPLVSASVQTSIEELLSDSSSKLYPYVSNYDLQFQSVTSTLSDAKPPENTGTCSVYPCRIINAAVTVSHQSTVTSGEVTEAMVPYREYINENLKNEEFQAEILNKQIVTTSITVTLNGDFTATMDNEESIYFSEVTSSFFNDQFEGEENDLRVNDIAVTGQEIYYNRRKRRSLSQIMSRFLQRGSDDSDGNGGYIDIVATVTGEYTPPPEVNFDRKVSVAIGEHEDEYIEDLKTGGDIEITDDGIVRSKPFFEKVEDVDVKLNNVAPTLSPTQLPIEDEGPNLILIVGSIIGGVAICFGLIVFWQLRGPPEDTPIGVVGLGASPLDKGGGFFGRKNSNRNIFDGNIMDAKVSYMNNGYSDVGYGVQTTQFPGEFHDGFGAPRPIAPRPIGGPSNRSLDSGTTHTSTSSGMGRGNMMSPHMQMLHQQSSRNMMLQHDERSVMSRELGPPRMQSLPVQPVGGRMMGDFDGRSVRNIGGMGPPGPPPFRRDGSVSGRGFARQGSGGRLTSLADIPIHER